MQCDSVLISSHIQDNSSGNSLIKHHITSYIKHHITSYIKHHITSYIKHHITSYIKHILHDGHGVHTVELSKHHAEGEQRQDEILNLNHLQQDVHKVMKHAH